MELNNWAIDLFEEVKMHRLLAKTRSMAFLRRKRSGVFFYLYDAKQVIYIKEGSISYKNPNYEDVLKREVGRYMSYAKPGTAEVSEMLCLALLDSRQIISKDTISR